MLCNRGSGKGSLRGLVNSSTKDVSLATDWWVRVRGGGEGLSCPPLIGSLSFFLFKFRFLSSGGGFTQNGSAILKWSRLGFTFHICFWRIIELQHYVRSWYTRQWFAISMHFKLITVIIPFLNLPVLHLYPAPSQYRASISPGSLWTNQQRCPFLWNKASVGEAWWAESKLGFNPLEALWVICMTVHSCHSLWNDYPTCFFLFMYVFIWLWVLVVVWRSFDLCYGLWGL